MLSLTSFAYVVLATSAISLTITKSSLLEPVREYAKQFMPWPVYKLLSCFYCLSHWVALLYAIVLLWPNWLEMITATFAVTGAAAIVSGLAIKLLHWDEQQISALMEENHQLQTSLGELINATDSATLAAQSR